MSVWYAASAFGLIFAATAVLYLVLSSNFDREDERFVTDSMSEFQLLLRASPTLKAPNVGPASHRSPSSDCQLYFRILDVEGRTVLESPDMAAVPVPSRTELASIRLADGVAREVALPSGRRFQTLTAPLAADAAGAPGYLQIAMDRAREESLLVVYRTWLGVILAVSLLACALVGRAIARAGMRPIEDIGRTAGGIGSTTLAERIDVSGLPAELASLAMAFNTMLARLEESFTRVSRFSDDVAHELRTPVNNLRGEIEVALGQPRSDEAYREVLGSCLEECARLSRIIQSLLFLARADEVGAGLARERTDVGQALNDVREFYEAAAADADVSLVLSVSDGLEAMLDRTLFQQAAGNLISNAIAHTPPGGCIALEAALESGVLTVRVRDTGSGIGREHLPYVFDRFYRVDRSRAGSPQNVGLGLAVVRSIVERHGGRASIASEPGLGVAVTLTFAPAS